MSGFERIGQLTGIGCVAAIAVQQTCMSSLTKRKRARIITEAMTDDIIAIEGVANLQQRSVGEQRRVFSVGQKVAILFI